MPNKPEPSMDSKIDALLKTMNDKFEAEIKAQEFMIDEAEWMSLIKALKVSQAEAKALIRTEKLKLLAEVRERVVGTKDCQPGDPAPDLVEHNRLVRDGLRFEQRIELNKMEAEL